MGLFDKPNSTLNFKNFTLKIQIDPTIIFSYTRPAS
jgi:hypothetical protein